MEIRQNVTKIQKMLSKFAFYRWNLHFFARICICSLKIVGIWLNTTKSSWIQVVYARFGHLFYSFGRVQVARVLEMQTRHSTRWCRFLRTKTRCRLIGPSVQARIGLVSGGFAKLSGSNRVWTALVVVVINGGFQALSFFSPLLLLTKHSFYPFSLLFFSFFASSPKSSQPNIPTK